MNYAVFEYLVEIKPGRYSLEFLVGVCAPSSPNPDAILDQRNVIFSHRFHTWLLTSILVFKPSLRNYHDQYIRFIYREKTVYSTTHKTVINRHMNHTGEMKQTFYVR